MEVYYGYHLSGLLFDGRRTRCVREENGFLVVEDALPPQLVKDLKAIVERLDAKYRDERGLEPHAPLNLLDFVGKDELFLELLDWPKTFPKVWGILGWNVQLYHSHLIVTHPRPADEPREQKRLGWHQDSGRLNFELEGNPRPRVSLKIGFFLSDTSVPGRGNFSVVPGSHLQNKLEFPSDGISNPEGARPICVPPGAAVFFRSSAVAFCEPKLFGYNTNGALLRLQLPMAETQR